MPRKRAAPSDSGTSQAKKTTTTKGRRSKAAPKDATCPPTQGSREMEWLAKPDEAWVWECSCPPRFERPISSFWEDVEDEEDEEDEEDDGDSEDKEAKQPECGGETCMCNKKAVDHPNYPWVLTMAGKQLYLSQHALATMRDPDNFEMYTFNDHYGYGLIEMLQNLILDYPESPLGRVVVYFRGCRHVAPGS